MNRARYPISASHAPRARGDRGAALAEFALVSPVLFLVLFSIIDFGWVFGQHLDVRHGAREGARLVAVNHAPLGGTGSAQTQAIASTVCGRLNNVGTTTVEISLRSSGANQVGDLATIEVETQAAPLTGFIPLVFQGLDLDSRIDVRLEADATWADGVGKITCL